MQLALPWIATLMSLAACSNPAGEAASAESGLPYPATGLSLELHAEKLEYRVGEKFRFTAELVNPSSSPITVVLPGDGSEVGWRTPIVRWTPPSSSLRCGLVDSVSARDLVLLEPSQRLAFDCLGAPVFDGPGTCQVSLEIEHDPNTKWGRLPTRPEDSATMDRIRRLPPYRVKSNTVQVIVRE